MNSAEEIKAKILNEIVFASAQVCKRLEEIQLLSKESGNVALTELYTSRAYTKLTMALRISGVMLDV